MSSVAQTGKQIRTSASGVIGPKVLSERKIPLIIDDFHFVEKATQEKIVRSLKEPVFEGVPIIFLSVPHRAYDAVRVEREMTGRVTQLQIPLWEDQELESIAERGFESPRANSMGRNIENLSKHCFQSPHLMQDFCAAICKDNGIFETQATVSTIETPPSWDDFYKRMAADASKTVFDRLAQGPRQRTVRKGRILKGGSSVDIYTLVLYAVAKTGPKPSLQYEDVRAAIQSISKADIPHSNEITSVLKQMTKIARELPGEPVLEWDNEYSLLHITDPFFAYYLKWGTPQL